MSQWSTFLYSPWLGIQSSRLNAWTVHLVIQSRQFRRPPGLDKANIPPRMQEDTSSYTHACMVEPTEAYKRRHIGLSSQSVLDSRVVNNPGPS